MSELLPCPFCGGERIAGTHQRDGRSIGCYTCGANIIRFEPNAHEKAAEAWNIRCGHPAPQTRGHDCREIEPGICIDCGKKMVSSSTAMTAEPFDLVSFQKEAATWQDVETEQQAHAAPPSLDTVREALALADEAARHCDEITALIGRPDWRTSKSRHEDTRNYLRRTLNKLRDLAALSVPAPIEAGWREKPQLTDEIVWLREVDAGTDNACWVISNRVDPGSVAFFRGIDFPRQEHVSQEKPHA